MTISDLFRPKWKHSDPEVRKLAAAKLTDETVLSDIAQNDTNSAVRLNAVRQLADPNRLARILDSESDIEVCRAALDKIKVSDSALLGRIAQQHGIREVRTAALKKLADFLSAAIMLGDSATAISLLDIPCDHFQHADQNGWTPLHCAAFKGDGKVPLPGVK